MLAFGFTNPLLVDETGVLIAGHGRLEAAVALGIEKVPTIVLRHLSLAQKDALRLADNRISENATWDQALLREALAGAQAAAEIDVATLGFSADELSAILAAAETAVTDRDTPEEADQPEAGGRGTPDAAETEDASAGDAADAEPDSPLRAVARPGDLWLLGEHRLLCGDSTDAAAVAHVMGADRAALLFTSPPYGSQRDYTTGPASVAGPPGRRPGAGEPTPTRARQCSSPSPAPARRSSPASGAAGGCGPSSSRRPMSTWPSPAGACCIPISR